MPLTYLQKLGRGWGILIDFFWVVLLWELLIVIAFLPCYLLAWIGEACGNTLSEAERIVGFAFILVYALFVAPVMLFYLVKYFGFPWKWVKDPTRMTNADRTVISISVEPNRAPEQEPQSPSAPRES